MTNGAGVVRSAESLAAAADELAHSIPVLGSSPTSWRWRAR